MKIKSSCFVPACKSGYPSVRRENKLKNIKNNSLFRAPRESALLEKWRRAIPRADRILQSTDVVCELHFLEHDILRNFETKFPDDTINIIARERPKLRKNAVPCIFTNLPSNLPVHLIDIVDSSSPGPNILRIEHPVAEAHATDPAVGANNEEFNIFQDIKNNLGKVTVPSTFWVGNYIEGLNEIVFSERDSSYTVKKKLVIKEDLSFKVYFGNTDIKEDCFKYKDKVTDIQDVINCLKAAHNLRLCRGLNMTSITKRMETTQHLPTNAHPGKTCSYRTKFPFQMRQHLRQHRTRLETDLFTCEYYYPEEHECEFCDFKCDLKVNLTHHVKTVHEEHEDSFELSIVKEYQCIQCGLKTFSLLMLLGHKYSSHSYCDDNFTVEADSNQEEIEIVHNSRKRENNRWFHCEHCPFKEKRLDLIKWHVFARHTNNEDTRWFRCRLNYYKIEIKSHSRRKQLVEPRVDPEDISWIYCEHCPFKSKTKELVKEHIVTKHPKSKAIAWFHCRHCSNKFRTTACLKLHIVAKHTSQQWFRCEQCSYRTKTKRNLKSHVFFKHTNDAEISWFCCEQCAYKSKTKRELTLHVKQMHTSHEDVCWFFCDYCSHKSKLKSTLKAHILVKHTEPENISWFYCEHCSYKSKIKAGLISHIKHMHTRD